MVCAFAPTSMAAAQASFFNAPRTGRGAMFVRVQNLSEVDAATLVQALEIASSVFVKAGVDVRGTTTEPPIAEDFQVFDLIIAEHAVETPRRRQLTALPFDVLGEANLPAHRAYAYYNRIRHSASWLKKGFATLILAEVIAHEVGHLLLPDSHHAAKGIMRRSVALRAHPVETFGGREIRLINDRLQQRLVGRRAIQANPPLTP
jgi:hypothetical protein